MGVQSITSYIDTNIAIFLHAGNLTRFTQPAVEQLERSDLLVSPIITLELEMLYEKGTLRYPASRILADLNQQLGLSVCQLPMAVIMNAALGVKWTREPGDRIIVANAIARNEAPLITSDRRINEHYRNSVW